MALLLKYMLLECQNTFKEYSMFKRSTETAVSTHADIT